LETISDWMQVMNDRTLMIGNNFRLDASNEW